jgi:hypothetical protein
MIAEPLVTLPPERRLHTGKHTVVERRYEHRGLGCVVEGLGVSLLEPPLDLAMVVMGEKIGHEHDSIEMRAQLTWQVLLAMVEGGKHTTSRHALHCWYADLLVSSLLGAGGLVLQEEGWDETDLRAIGGEEADSRGLLVVVGAVSARRSPSAQDVYIYEREW